MQRIVWVLVAAAWLAGCNSVLTRPDAGAVSAHGSNPAPAAAVTAPAGNQPEASASSAQQPLDKGAPHVTLTPESTPPEAAPAPPKDLWAQLRRGFQLHDYAHARVDQQLQWYASHTEYMQRVMTRAEPFLYMILNEVEKRHMPTEIALLPVVESAFQPFAYSHGRAAGIWQFIPSTGRLYGLKQNWWYDGRRDVVASTKAALDYLQKLHDQFNGDWLLALAAYNSGEGTVQRAIERNQRKHLPTDFWSLDLPRETQGYAPRLLAVAMVIGHPRKYGLNLQSVPNQAQLAHVKVGSQIDMALAAQMAGISVEEMYKLNPGFNRWATAPKGPHILLVPIEKRQRFEEKLAALPASERIQWKRHKIVRGDSLNLIARRYHTTPEMLKRVNHLRGSTIVAGQHLIIPIARRAFSHYELTALQRRKALLKVGAANNKTIHVVRSGDTFWELSRRYGVSVRKIARWNGMAPRDHLVPGRKLVIHGVAKAQKVSYTLPTGRGLPLAAMLRPIRYTVRHGDSLAVIARRFNVTIHQLCKWNRVDKDDYLQPGQRLTLYVDVTRQADSS